jgi:DNA-directed RNA polymerase subunit RPC12/RpoP
MKSQMASNSTSNSTPVTSSSASNDLGPSIFESFAATSPTSDASPNLITSPVSSSSPARTDTLFTSTFIVHVAENVDSSQSTILKVQPTHRPSHSLSSAVTIVDKDVSESISTNLGDPQSHNLVKRDIVVEPSPQKRRGLDVDSQLAVATYPHLNQPGSESPLFVPMAFESDSSTSDRYNLLGYQVNHLGHESLTGNPQPALTAPPPIAFEQQLPDFFPSPITNLYHCTNCGAEKHVLVKSDERLVCDLCGGRMFWKAHTTKTRCYNAC